jgi:hypothetical protein
MTMLRPPRMPALPPPTKLGSGATPNVPRTFEPFALPSS